jgi:hypothetical protein
MAFLAGLKMRARMTIPSQNPSAALARGPLGIHFRANRK